MYLELILTSIIFYGIYKCVIYYERNLAKPRQYSAKNMSLDLASCSNNNRDGFSKKKIPEDIDVIIIGSGISALTCAGLLSRVGKRVLVLEQHYIAGGSTHLFEDKGFEFDTGVHYLGRIHKRQKLLDLITSPKMEWDKMGTAENNYVYDEIVVAGERFNIPAGREAYLKMIKEKFPNEVNVVEVVSKYLDDCNETSNNDMYFKLKVVQCKWLAYLLRLFTSKKFFQDVSITALDKIKSYTNNTRLQALLLGQFGDYGTDPSKDPFFMHAGVVSHYLDGGWFPRGGSSNFAKSIIPVIESTGGHVLVRKAVEEIIIENGEAVGVRMKRGVEIRAKSVVSACGLPNTWKKLVPEEYVPRSLVEKIDKVGYSGSFTYVFIGMDKDPDELKLRSSNIWHWPNEDYPKMIQDFYKDPLKAPMPMFIGFPCAKDKTWKERFPGKSNAVILTLSKYEHFEEWADKRQGHRGEEYEAIKDKYAQRILKEGLYKHYPQTEGCVSYLSVSTPITFNHFIGSQRGEAYGMSFNKDRVELDDWILPTTHIKNLYQTGQDITTLGVTGAMNGGVITANSMLGYGSKLDILSGRDLEKDLKRL